MTEKNFEPALLFSDCRSEGVGLGLQRGGAIRAVWLRLWGGGEQARTLGNRSMSHQERPWLDCEQLFNWELDAAEEFQHTSQSSTALTP